LRKRRERSRSGGDAEQTDDEGGLPTHVRRYCKPALSGSVRRQKQARATRQGATGNRAQADRFAANVLPVVREIEAAGSRH
jgi:hypothetical protein